MTTKFYQLSRLTESESDQLAVFLELDRKSHLSRRAARQAAAIVARARLSESELVDVTGPIMRIRDAADPDLVWHFAAPARAQ